MLRFLRRNARSWIMYIILAIIIFVFVLYFGSSPGDRSTRAIAVIDRTVITEEEFRDEYDKLLDIARQRYADKLTPELLKNMDLKKVAYDGLLNRQIIIAKAADLKVEVSNEELKNSILNLSAFQTEGVFDERKYRQMLRYNRMSAEDFEVAQKINLTASKIESLVRDGIKISDHELLDVYAMQNQKINVEFIQLSAKNIKKDIVPTEAELRNYLKSNSNRFRVPAQVKVKYLSFRSNDFAPGSIADSEIRDYYELHKNAYKTKEGKQLPLAKVKNTILKKLRTSQGLRHAYAEAKKAHDTIYQEDNFESYAAKNKLTVNSLDFFFVDKPPQEFASVKDLSAILMDLEKNEISKVVKTENSCYLFLLIDKKTAYLPPLQEIKKVVEKSFAEDERQNLAEKEAIAILERLKKEDVFSKIAKEKGLDIKETGFFQPGNAIPKLGLSEDATEALLQLTTNNPYPGKPFFINSTYVIFKLKELSKVDFKDFEEKKDLYKRIFVSIKREEALQTWLEGNKEAMRKEGRIKIKKEVKDL